MADTKISQLPAATTPLSGAEVVPLVQSGATVQTPVNEISLLTAATANTFTANQIISVTDNTNAALRVTQLGTGLALRIEDSTNPDSTPVVVDASGNVGIGTTPTFSQEPQTITFTTPPVKTQYDVNLKVILDARVDSGLPLSFVSSDEGVATVTTDAQVTTVCNLGGFPDTVNWAIGLAVDASDNVYVAGQDVTDVKGQVQEIEPWRPFGVSTPEHVRKRLAFECGVQLGCENRPRVLDDRYVNVLRLRPLHDVVVLHLVGIGRERRRDPDGHLGLRSRDRRCRRGGCLGWFRRCGRFHCCCCCRGLCPSTGNGKQSSACARNRRHLATTRHALADHRQPHRSSLFRASPPMRTPGPWVPCASPAFKGDEWIFLSVPHDQRVMFFTFFAVSIKLKCIFLY